MEKTNVKSGSIYRITWNEIATILPTEVRNVVENKLAQGSVPNETADTIARLESVEKRLEELEVAFRSFNDTFSSTQRKERASWKDFSNEELRLYQQTQSSMMGSVKLLGKTANAENQKTLAAIKEHGVILSNRVAIVLLILFYIAFGGWMYCMTKLLQ